MANEAQSEMQEKLHIKTEAGADLELNVLDPNFKDPVPSTPYLNDFLEEHTAAVLTSTSDVPPGKPPINRRGTSRELRFGSICDTFELDPNIARDHSKMLPPGVIGRHGHSHALSINFALVLIFGLSVAALGTSLIVVSENFLDRSESLQGQGSFQIQTILLDLVNESSTDLELATNDSVNHLVRVVLDQTYRRALELFDNYTRWCEFSVQEMVDLWRDGLLDPRDLDRSRAQLWKVLLRFDAVTRVGFADKAGGNYVGIQRLPGGVYDLEMRNESGTKCAACYPGALPTYKYYWNVAAPFQETGWVFATSKPNDPRTRPWFVAAEAGNGSGRWTDVYTLSLGSSVAITAARAVLGPGGAVLGVVAADMTLEFIAQVLQQIQVQLRVPVPGGSYAGTGLVLVALDRFGNMLGTSTNDRHRPHPPSPPHLPPHTPAEQGCAASPLGAASPLDAACVRASRLLGPHAEDSLPHKQQIPVIPRRALTTAPPPPPAAWSPTSTGRWPSSPGPSRSPTPSPAPAWRWWPRAGAATGRRRAATRRRRGTGPTPTRGWWCRPRPSPTTGACGSCWWRRCRRPTTAGRST